MGCHLSRSASLEGSDGDAKAPETPNSAAATKNDSVPKKARGSGKKKASGTGDASSAAAVGNKLAHNQEAENNSPELRNGVRRDGDNPSLAANSIIAAASQPPLPPDKLHKNFQERLVTSGITSSKPNGPRGACDSQVEFFRMLDERIAQGQEYESETDG